MTQFAFFPGRVLSLSLLALLLVGCGQDNADLDAWIEGVKSRPAKDLDLVPAAPEYDKFAYTAHALRDPFLPFQVARGDGNGPRPDTNRTREPLEDFPIDALRMAGTIGQGGGRQGLVVDPNNITHRISVGRYLGKNDGRVVGVSDERIDLIELVPVAGGWEEQPAALVLEEP